MHVLDLCAFLTAVNVVSSVQLHNIRHLTLRSVLNMSAVFFVVVFSAFWMQGTTSVEEIVDDDVNVLMHLVTALCAFESTMWCAGLFVHRTKWGMYFHGHFHLHNLHRQTALYMDRTLVDAAVTYLPFAFTIWTLGDACSMFGLSFCVIGFNTIIIMEHATDGHVGIHVRHPNYNLSFIGLLDIIGGTKKW